MTDEPGKAEDVRNEESPPKPPSPTFAPKGKLVDWKRLIFMAIMLAFIFSVLTFAFILGNYAKACEISSLQDYVRHGGTINLTNDTIFIGGLK